MSKCGKGNYHGGHTVLTQNSGSYEAEMARAAQRAKRRAALDQKLHDTEKHKKLQRKLQELAKFAPRKSPPGMRAITTEELKQKYPEGVPQWMLGHSADEIERLMDKRRKRFAKAANERGGTKK